MIEDIRKDIPIELWQLIDGAEFEENQVGCSDTKVYKVSNVIKHQSSYLKISKNKHETFRYEVELLKWLKGKLPVPEVLYYGNTAEYEFFLMTEVPGKDCSNIEDFSNKSRLAEALAEGLKLIHSVDISDCPFNQRLDFKLNNAKFNVENGLTDEEDIKSTDPRRTGEGILKILYETKPSREDLVLTHGDYCLPNIILNHNYELVGFIDWGRGGVSDKYQDIGIACRSIKHNIGEEMIPIFLEKYGLDFVDKAKIEYYILLDELF